LALTRSNAVFQRQSGDRYGIPLIPIQRPKEILPS
jgi:hypothetical protein